MSTHFLDKQGEDFLRTLMEHAPLSEEGARLIAMTCPPIPISDEEAHAMAERAMREAHTIDLGEGGSLLPQAGGFEEDPVGCPIAEAVCAIWRHRNRSGSPCAGTVRFGHGDPFRVLAREPLTLYPSLNCAVCGKHGWVRGGKWEEA